MKNYLYIIIILFSNLITGQSKNNQNESLRVNEFYYHQTATSLSNELYDEIHEALNNNLDLLKKNNNLININSSSDLKYGWPLKQADGYNYINYWLIANYYDHDEVQYSVTDYNCGQKTFDYVNDFDYSSGTAHGHRAVDIVPSPYPWKMMDDEQVEVVAAADGQIILITDGNKDDNCDLNNSDFWNAVYLKHSDGSTTWYGRLKSGTLTTKEVGDYVNKGEFLGHPGSGGKSFYPHLHFEVYDSQNNSVDPFAGPCNNQIDESLWESQPVYANDDTVVNALLTHSEPPNLQACGQTEYNLSNEFLPGSTMYPAVYFRAVKSGQVLNMKLINPYGSVVSDLDYSFQQDYQSNYFYSSYAIPESAFLIGTWVFQANFLGNVYSINFEVKSSLSTKDITDDVLFLSEINNSKLRIHSNNLISKAEIFDLNGRLIKSKSFNNNDFEIGIHNLKSGIYLINIFNESFEVFKTLKFVKN